MDASNPEPNVVPPTAGLVSIEKAILLDVCLGAPLGRIFFPTAAAEDAPPVLPAPGTFLFRGDQLARMRLLHQRGEPQITRAVLELAAAANAAMALGPFSVTHKPGVPEGADPHDYHSPAKYWWPSPGASAASPYGLPYVRRDGEVNPACYSADSDYPRLVEFSETVVLLALAGYLTGNRAFAEQAFRLISAWFLDEATRQNPHFGFAQHVPGQSGLRAQAVIESRHLAYVTEAILLLEGMEVISGPDMARLRDWHRQLLGWLRSSEEGLRAGSAANNIGFWYDLQCLVLAQFTGDAAQVERIAREVVIPRLDAQIAPDGSLPQELARAHPQDYIAFTLAAMALVGRAAEAGGVPLWTYQDSDGRNFQVVQDWLTRTFRTYRGFASAGGHASVTDDLGTDETIAILLDVGIQMRAVQRLAARNQSAATAARSRLDKAQNRAAVLEAEASTLGAEARAAHGELKNVRQQNQALTGEAEALRAVLAQARTDLNDQHQRLQRAEHERVALTQQIGSLGADLEALRRYGHDLEKKHIAMLRSSSWRAVEPLRKAVRFVTRKSAPKPFVPRLTTPSPKPGLPARSAQGGPSEARRLASWVGKRLLPGKTEADARRQVGDAKRRLLNLGFHKRALQDLRKQFETTSERDLRRLAGFELAVWHANRYAATDAETCLNLLDAVEQTGVTPEMARWTAVLRAESLDILGRPDATRAVLEGALARAPHADLHLAQVHLGATEAEKCARLNRAFALHGLSAAELLADDGRTPYDRLRAAGERVADAGAAPKVSVIVPAFNAEAMIATTIESLLAQTWENLEILVSDDCSTDGTTAVVEAYTRRDGRLRLIRGVANSGPYVARNRALLEAAGDYVTCNDSDDWSHPQKIARQVEHLLKTPAAVANTSQQARVSEALKFFRRGNPGFYLQVNMSSLMFRREAVLGAVGYWDSVRFAADSEFVRRLKCAFGTEAIVDLPTGPLSFQRQTNGSLTGSATFGYQGYKMGARKVYEDAFQDWHQRVGRPRIGFPLASRPFPVPEPMRPHRSVQRDGTRHFDVVLVSDFRMPGGTSMSNIEEIKAQRRMGLRTGLVQMGRYDLNPTRPMNAKIAEMIDGDRVDLLVNGEKITCDLAVVRLPWVLEEFQEYIPSITARDLRVIVNQPPKRDYADGSPYIYHPQKGLANLKRYFGATGLWHPIGPLVRNALVTHHAAELAGIALSPEDWTNIIDIAEWRRLQSPPRKAGCIRICRHSRDQYVKWPADRATLLAVYPDAPEFEVHILGGAETPKAILDGRLPRNWHVTGFGEAEPADFLAQFDVFVYYTHPDWVESFGRVIFEAMAVGLPVFLPPVYEPLFRDAAIYAGPAAVASAIRALMADPAAYEAQVARALAYVDANFGYVCHARRVGGSLGRDLAAAGLGGDPLARGESALTGSAEALGSFDPAALRRDTAAGKAGGASGRLVAQLLADAEAALVRGPFSVTHKTTLPPSGDPRDYWHPAPYWWPDPTSATSLPYVRRDGLRVPGTLMYEPDSEKYDRTRVQRLFDDSTLLTLAWQASGDAGFARKAVEHLDCFFVEPATRMNPHLDYAQVKLGHGGDRGSSSGLIELKDFYYYLDAVRLLAAGGMLRPASLEAFRAWLQAYLRWLLDARQGRSEAASGNNHGTFYDLQVAAIAGFLDHRALLQAALRRARGRLDTQFAADGSQPEELRRSTTAHYCCFNFQGWLALVHLAQRWGVDLWSGGRLPAGAQWLLGHAGRPWPYPQIDDFDTERFFPLWHLLPAGAPPIDRPAAVPADPRAVKPIFHPHDGIRPYWNLGLT